MLNVDFPLHFNTFGRSATADRDRHIRNMIEQFLFTSHGERVNRPDFGSGLLQLIFAPNSAELASTLQFTIQAGLQRWLGDVLEVQALEVSSEDSTLRVFIQYLVRQTGEVRTDEFVRSLS
jgi:uncharacterized protein